MATTTWRSSLGNIETRLRRSLGIAGPIALEISKDLTPVVISDDSTRPGASSSLRGRRWKGTMTMQVAAAAQGSVWLFCDAPAAGSQSRTDPFAGGAILDYVDICPIVPTAPANIVQIGMVLFPTNLVIAPGIPTAVTNPGIYYSDPLRSSTEQAPLYIGYGNAVPVQTNGGILIWQGGFRADGTTRFWWPTEIFMNWNSCVAIGNLGAAAAAIDMYVNVHGRIF
jgi:hypothetical protein